MKWYAAPEGRWYDAGESTVVYFDAYSGDTHLLGDLAGYVVRLLGAEPLTTDDLVNRMHPESDYEDVSELKQAVSRVLEELAVLEILKRE